MTVRSLGIPATKPVAWDSITGKPAVVFKDIKARLATNSSGVWTKTYASGFWAAEPSVNVNPISSSVVGQISWKTTKTQTAGAWTVRVDFSLTASVLGILTLGVSPGTVLFDYSAAEVNT